MGYFDPQGKLCNHWHRTPKCGFMQERGADGWEWRDMVHVFGMASLTVFVGCTLKRLFTQAAEDKNQKKKFFRDARVTAKNRNPRERW